MEIKDLKGKLPEEVIESSVKRGIKSLTPPQASAVGEGLLSGKNLVIASPTASGKTFIAEMAMLKTVIWDRKKAVYIAPMRALVTEKYNELKSNYPYIKTAMSIGDLDSLDHWLDRYDVILVSTEKLDSLIRHGVKWLEEIGCVVFDEVHTLDDVSRGPTLEILVTRLKRTCPEAQLIALSATIGNAEEISEWLGSGLVRSEYRPVPLKKGIELKGIVNYSDEETEELKGTSKLPELLVAEDTLEKGKQILVFYSTRRNAEAGGERMGEMIYKRLDEKSKEALKSLSVEILEALSKPTAQCEKLARQVEHGVAFHHSGLVNRQRNLIEDAFKDGRIKAICATTTLAFGMNLPAHTVLVRDTTRYNGMDGVQKISTNEILQLFGRAGRPAYDKEGRAILIASSEEEALLLYRKYIDAKPEPILSKLGVLPVLRTHILGFIASGFLTRNDSILGFLGETFYGYQQYDQLAISQIVDTILEELLEWQFIKRNGTAYEATKLGSKVSELYIDPISAKWIIDTIPIVVEMPKDEIPALFMISNTLEMRPYSKATREATEEIVFYSHMLRHTGDLESYYEPERPFSTALMLREWISERSEADILKKYGETPGSLYTKITNADWLIYSSIELSKVMRVGYIPLLEMRARLRYGIKKELLDLVRLEQVGRVRARIMYGNGIKGVRDLRKEGAEQKLERLFGKEIAKKIYGQVSAFAD